MNFGFSSLPADTHKVLFLPCYHGWARAVRLAVLVVAWRLRVTPAMAAVQLGYSTESEALSDTTM